ncbi:MAG: hypothetical protein E7625_05740 [Ruminococcaceae bacterium]|nr:hypothetical protein [Oscillospiraceae bacterium]
MRRAFGVLMALIFVLLLAACADQERIETTYDEQGNVIREDYYYDNELSHYIVYDYDETSRLTTETTYTSDNVKTMLVEYTYHSNGKTASENMLNYDNDGQKNGRQLLEYDTDGNKTKLCHFDAQDRPLSSTGYSKLGNPILFENWEYDANGNFTGRRVMEQTEEALVIREETYDANDKLMRKSTYSYHANGVQAEHRTVNGDGHVIHQGILDENGTALYEEFGTFHDNGNIKQSLQIRYESDVRITKEVSYDENGTLVETEITHANDAGPIKTEKTNAAGEVIYYKDATRLDEMLFDKNGAYIGRYTAEYYADGQPKYEKEVNATGQLLYERTLSENGIPLKNESNTYNEAGLHISHSYEESLNEDILLKSERWTRDDQGNEIEKRIAHYDEYGNVILDEEYKNGELLRRYTAEYYGPEQPRREELYQNDAMGEYTRIQEFYENGQQKSDSTYDKDGTLVSQTTWDAEGNVTSSQPGSAGGAHNGSGNGKI